MKKQIFYLSAFLILVSCSDTQQMIRPTSSTGYVKDIDDNVYKTVKIGNQWWMAENLKVTHYRNADAIPNVTDETDWNPTTNIEYQLAQTSLVDLSIYNMLGQKVATLVNINQPAGTYNVQWDALGFASGIYYYRFEAANFVKTRKLVLLK